MTSSRLLSAIVFCIGLLFVLAGAAIFALPPPPATDAFGRGVDALAGVVGILAGGLLMFVSVTTDIERPR